MSRPELTMHWLPTQTDLGQRLRSLNSVTDATARLTGLTAIAQTRLGYLETIQVDNALRRVDTSSVSDFTRLRVALLSSSTVDHLAPPIRVAGLRRRLLIDVFIGAFGQYRQEIFDEASTLRRSAPQVVVLSLDARQAIA